MKFNLLIKIIVFCGLFIFIACDEQGGKKHAEQKFFSLWTNTNQGTTKFYSIALSIRKIDSLTAELNLRFSKRNALGLY